MKKQLGIWLAVSVLCAGCGQPSVQSASPTPGSGEEYTCRLMDFYDYASPAPVSPTVDDAYFDGVLFAGDSRMGSLALYGTHPNAEIAYVTSLNLLLIDTMKADEREDGATLMDILRSTQKPDIYLLFGINEIRNANFSAFNEQYQMILTMLRENNPAVNIYILLAYHPDYISNLPEPQLSEHLQMLNDGLRELAQNNYVYYLDPDNGLDDENGTIKDEYVADGLHFNPDGAHAFEAYIATHVVRKDKYVQTVCE